MAKLICLILLGIPAFGDMLLEYYDTGQTGFTELQSISDSETTSYVLLGGNELTWPAWVGSASEPSGMQIVYDAPEEMTYHQGICSTNGTGCGVITWTTTTVDVMFSSNQVDQNEFLFVDPPTDPPPTSAPEPGTWAMVGTGFLLLGKKSVRRLLSHGG